MFGSGVERPTSNNDGCPGRKVHLPLDGFKFRASVKTALEERDEGIGFFFDIGFWRHDCLDLIMLTALSLPYGFFALVAQASMRASSARSPMNLSHRSGWSVRYLSRMALPCPKSM